MAVRVTVSSSANRIMTGISNGSVEKTVVLPPKALEPGSAVNGGDLLLLSLAVCYCHTCCYIAKEKDITIDEIEVVLSGDFNTTPDAMEAFRFKVRMKSSASAAALQEIVRIADTRATIPHLVRNGLQVIAAD